MHTMQTAITPTQEKKYNILDVFLMLALAASIHKTNKGVRNCAWNLFYQSDDEAKEVLRTLAINTQNPLEVVVGALQSYQSEQPLLTN